MASRIRRAAFSASTVGSNTSVAGVSVHFSTESRLRWLMQSNSRMESTSSVEELNAQTLAARRRIHVDDAAAQGALPLRPPTMLTRS